MQICNASGFCRMFKFQPLFLKLSIIKPSGYLSLLNATTFTVGFPITLNIFCIRNKFF